MYDALLDQSSDTTRGGLTYVSPVSIETGPALQGGPQQTAKNPIHFLSKILIVCEVVKRKFLLL